MTVGSADEERTRVVTAAHALLAEENAAFELTIDAVAARAGVARAQVQRRWVRPRRLRECAGSHGRPHSASGHPRGKAHMKIF
jgi:hypothetical protein